MNDRSPREYQRLSGDTPAYRQDGGTQASLTLTGLTLTGIPWAPKRTPQRVQGVYLLTPRDGAGRRARQGLPHRRRPGERPSPRARRLGGRYLSGRYLSGRPPPRHGSQPPPPPPPPLPRGGGKSPAALRTRPARHGPSEGEASRRPPPPPPQPSAPGPAAGVAGGRAILSANRGRGEPSFGGEGTRGGRGKRATGKEESREGAGDAAAPTRPAARLPSKWGSAQGAAFGERGGGGGEGSEAAAPPHNGRPPSPPFLSPHARAAASPVGDAGAGPATRPGLPRTCSVTSSGLQWGRRRRRSCRAPWR